MVVIVRIADEREIVPSYSQGGADMYLHLIHSFWVHASLTPNGISIGSVFARLRVVSNDQHKLLPLRRRSPPPSSAVFTYGQSGHMPRAYQFGWPTLEYNILKTF